VTTRTIQPHKIIPLNESEKIAQNFYHMKSDHTILSHAKL